MQVAKRALHARSDHHGQIYRAKRYTSITDDVRPATISPMKRAFDIAGALVAIVFFAPFMIGAAIAIMIADGRPVFFRHRRVGRNGKLFDCLKFRSMVHDADAKLFKLLRENPDARDEWVKTRKLKNDPRVIGIGRLLRASSLDELPQLFNVLKGQMSLVGPRPVLPEELDEHYGDAGRQDYMSVTPGCTGLWQVSGRSDTSYEARVALDREYVKSQNLFYDIAILWKTVGVLLWRKGAY